MKDSALYNIIATLIESYERKLRKYENAKEGGKDGQIEALKWAIKEAKSVLEYESNKAKRDAWIRKEKERRLKEESEERDRAWEEYNNLLPPKNNPNKECRNYTETTYQNGASERGCKVGMDMSYCGRDCAYATNMPGYVKH